MTTDLIMRVDVRPTTIKLSSLCPIAANRELGIEITFRLQRAWACFQRYKMETYDHPVRAFSSRWLKAEVIEALLYGCMT